MPDLSARRSAFALCVVTALAAGVTAQQSVSPTRPHVETLASERFEGRQAGSEGERLAGDYISAQLARMGARPLPGRTNMFMPFEFAGGSRDGGSALSINGVAAEAASVQALSFSDDADVSGDAVFVGYGLVVPDTQGYSYDSYAALDVKDKVVVVLRYFPEDADQRTRAILARYSDLRYKAMAARQRGARALLVVTGPRSPNAGQVIPMTFDTALAGSGIAAASISGRVAEAIFARATGGMPVPALASLQEQLDSGNPHVGGVDLPGVTLTVRTRVVRQRQSGRNVLAYLPATGPVSDRPWIVIGAHYDHLGRGAHGNSLAPAAEAGGIHHGADDNASGTAAVLALAQAMSTVPRRRHVLMAFWSAEEIGLVGSAAFVAAPPVPVSDLAAYINFDMVGRMQNNRLVAQATGTSPTWPTLLERANVAAGFDLAVQADPYQPTDVATFNQAGVPSLSFSTGSHADYHKPSDTAEKITYEDLDRVVALGAAIVRSLADMDQPPQFTKVEQPSSRGSMAGLRVTTGTIPDYTSEAKGLLLGGVIAGGPAEQAGLTKGDLVIEIGRQTIANIYDYTYALELLKVGQPVTIVYMRGGVRHETVLIPAARR